MGVEEEIQDALLAIHSKLNTIEGKVTLVARADRDRILAVLEDVVARKPIVGQIYLLLDGRRTQQEVHQALLDSGITVSQPTVSRRMTDMSREYGLADLQRGGSVKVFRKNREMEDVLNLARRVKGWLRANGERIPGDTPAKRASAKRVKGRRKQ